MRHRRQSDNNNNLLPNGGGATATVSKTVSSAFKSAARRVAGVVLPQFRHPEIDAYVAPIQHGPIRLGTARTVRNAHALGHKVIFWMVNDEAEMRRVMTETRCDGIVTDRTDIAVRVFKELGIYESPTTTTSMHAPPYFAPIETPHENHTCVSPACRFVFLVVQRLLLILTLGPTLAIILAILFYRCAKKGVRITSRKEKQH